MLCAQVCVYIYIQRLSSFSASTLWFSDLTVATCHIQIIRLSEFNAHFYHEKTDKTRKYSKSAIFLSYKNGHRQLLDMQKSFFNTDYYANYARSGAINYTRSGANYTRSGVVRSDAWILGRLMSSVWNFSVWITDTSLVGLRRQLTWGGCICWL